MGSQHSEAQAPTAAPSTAEARFVVGNGPPLQSGDLARASGALLRVARRKVRANDLDARDPGFIADVEPVLGALYDHYFRCVTEVQAPLPKGPFLAVANHNGMTGTPDMFCHMCAFWRLEGFARPAYGLMHDMPFHLPAAGAWLNAAGAVRACHDNARRALDGGAAVLVFPGGDVDACKPYRERYQIKFGRRRGFIRLALAAKIPIVPVVSVGGHESLYLLSDGQFLAKRLGLHAWVRTQVAPLGFALPFGFVFGVGLPHLPPPVKVHTRFLAPVAFDGWKGAQNDPAFVEACYEQVMTRMQAAMNELEALGTHGLFPRRAPVSPRSMEQR